MTRIDLFIVFTLLITLFINSCSLFGGDESFSCENLVVTREDGPEPIEYRGDPSDQWKVTGIQTEYQDGENVKTLRVRAAYPNPNYQTNKLTYLTYNLPKDMRVKVRIRNNNGTYDRKISDNYQPAGRHSNVADLSESSNECFRVDFYFDGSKKSNAFGFFKTEEYK